MIGDVHNAKEVDRIKGFLADALPLLGQKAEDYAWKPTNEQIARMGGSVETPAAKLKEYHY